MRISYWSSDVCSSDLAIIYGYTPRYEPSHRQAPVRHRRPFAAGGVAGIFDRAVGVGAGVGAGRRLPAYDEHRATWLGKHKLRLLPGCAWRSRHTRLRQIRFAM